MIEKFATTSSLVRSEFLNLNHTSKIVTLASFTIPKFAWDAGFKVWRASESGH